MKIGPIKAYVVTDLTDNLLSTNDLALLHLSTLLGPSNGHIIDRTGTSVADIIKETARWTIPLIVNGNSIQIISLVYIVDSLQKNTAHLYMTPSQETA